MQATEAEEDGEAEEAAEAKEDGEGQQAADAKEPGEGRQAPEPAESTTSAAEGSGQEKGTEAKTRGVEA